MKIRNKKWTKEKLIKELRDIRKNKKEIITAKKIGPSLCTACCRYFGSFNKAKFAAGLKLIRPHYKNKLPDNAYFSSKELAWLIGYILGDGYITQNNTVIGMKTKDNEIKNLFIKYFRNWSNYNNFIIDYYNERIQKFSNGTYKCKPIWSVRVCFKEAGLFLKQFKDKPIYSLQYFPNKYWKYILKGLWDAEGNINLNKNRIRIIFTNYRLDILKLYETICSYLNFRYSKDKTHIYISNLPDVIRLVDEIGITIKRKYTIQLKNRFAELRNMTKIYYKVKNLKRMNLKRREIWRRIDKRIPLGTLDGWLYGNVVPCYIDYKLK